MRNRLDFCKHWSGVLVKGQDAVAFSEFHHGHLNGALAVGCEASYRRSMVVACATAATAVNFR